MQLSLSGKADNSIRFAFQNINGMKLDSEHHSEEVNFGDFEIDLLGMAETNLAWSLDERIRLASILYLKYHGACRYTTSAARTERDSGYTKHKGEAVQQKNEPSWLGSPHISLPPRVTHSLGQ